MVEERRRQGAWHGSEDDPGLPGHSAGRDREKTRLIDLTHHHMHKIHPRHATPHHTTRRNSSPRARPPPRQPGRDSPIFGADDNVGEASGK